MPQASPLLDVPIEDCDSPSGSSTSEPHDDSMQIQQPFIDESFFYKLDSVPPDNPLYFMQQQQQAQQMLLEQQLQKSDNNIASSSHSAGNHNHNNSITLNNHGSPTTIDEDQSMGEVNDSDLASAASPLHNNIRQTSVERQSPLIQQQQQQQQFQQQFIPSTTASSNNGSVVEPLQPSTSSVPEQNQTFWSGVNNVIFFAISIKYIPECKSRKILNA